MRPDRSTGRMGTRTVSATLLEQGPQTCTTRHSWANRSVPEGSAHPSQPYSQSVARPRQRLRGGERYITAGPPVPSSAPSPRAGPRELLPTVGAATRAENEKASQLSIRLVRSGGISPGKGSCLVGHQCTKQLH